MDELKYYLVVVIIIMFVMVITAIIELDFQRNKIVALETRLKVVEYKLHVISTAEIMTPIDTNE